MAARDATLPDLQLHDIFHNMSPSPTPLQADLNVQNIPRSATPEVLTEADIAQMRRRAAEIASSSKGTGNGFGRETELLAMVRRLTESPLIDPGQLMSQAELISRLTTQRDFMIRQTEEERGRWASQRDGWDRMAEALIAQRNKSTAALSKEDIDRYCASYQAENKALQDKLNIATARLQCLDDEVKRLRPILLMEPVTTGSSISHYTSLPAGVPYPSMERVAEKAAEKLKPKKKKLKKEPRVPVLSATVPDEQDPPEERVETQQTEGVDKSSSSSSFFQFQAQPIQPPITQPAFTGDHYRKPSAPPIGGPLTAPPTTLEFQVSTPTPPPAPESSTAARTIRHPSVQPRDNVAGTSTNEHPVPKKKYTGPRNPFASDARAEHLILAGRMIGRKRAAIVAGYVRDRSKEVELQRQEREREKIARVHEREKFEKERLDRIATGASYYREAGPSSSGSGKAATESSPRTPKADARSSASPTPGPRVNMSYVHIEPVRDGHSGNGGGKGKAPQQSGSGKVLGTPKQQHGAPAAFNSQSQGNPSTPLSSLIDAARMMGDDDGPSHNTRNGGGASRGRKNGANNNSEILEGGAGSGRRRGVAAVEQPASPPAPKRRRVASARAAAAASTANASSKTTNGNETANGNGSGSSSRNGNGGNDAMSALHVLADQAAAFSSQGKGKGHEQDEEWHGAEDGEGDGDYAPVMPPKRTRKGKAPAKEKEKKEEKPKTKPPTTTRKPRGKAALAATPASAPAVPRLISPPGPAPNSKPSADRNSNSPDKYQFQPMPLEVWGKPRGCGAERGTPVSNLPIPVADSDVQGEAREHPTRTPPAEIRDAQSRSSPAPTKDDVPPITNGFGTEHQGQQDPETPLVVRPSTSSDEDAGRKMDVDPAQAPIETVDHRADEQEPVVNSLPQSKVGPESSLETMDLLRDAGGDGEGDIDVDADAEGEVDAEGEIDLEDGAITMPLAAADPPRMPGTHQMWA
ncbi:hypothetical protein C0991_000663 [Blastosporella zonata]|nr:hypothetical protein C0991_000663 [Blastosporella zonata]